MVLLFFNDTATTEIYTLSLHDALPIWADGRVPAVAALGGARGRRRGGGRLPGAGGPVARARYARGGRRAGCGAAVRAGRSEEHTSELQSRQYLVCRLLLEKKTYICLQR